MKTNISRKLIILGLLLFTVVATAATISRVKTFSDGEILTAADLNAEFDNVVDGVNSITNDNIASNAAISPAKISSAIKGSGLTRNSTSGALSVNVDNVGVEISGDNIQLKDLGVTTAKINDLAVTTGKIAANAVTRAKVAVIDQIPAGSIMQFHTFNGAVSIPRGWMIMNGNVVNEANYNAIHGAGTYTTDGVASSALLSKNLPNMTSRYPVGVAATTQNGSVAITAVGNSGNTVNLQHSHPAGSLYGQMNDSANLLWRRITTESWTYNRSFAPLGTGTPTSTTSDGLGIGGSTGNALSTTQSIQPDSIQLIFIIKVI
jgi:hypothetical protein